MEPKEHQESLHVLAQESLPRLTPFQLRVKLGENVKNLRSQNESVSSQGKLARKAGLSLSTPSLIEKADVAASLDTICKLANAFEVSPRFLFATNLEARPKNFTPITPESALEFFNAKVREIAPRHPVSTHYPTLDTIANLAERFAVPVEHFFPG